MLVLIHLSHFNSSVISLQNLLDIVALPGQTISPYLEHASGVPPTSSGEDESGYTIIFGLQAIDYKELFTQSQRRADSPAANVASALSANDFQIDHAPRRSTRGNAQVRDCADAAN